MEATETLAPAANGLLARVRQLLDRLVELDFTQPQAFAALAAASVLSRLYWLDLGYGTDPDAWRVALTAEYLWDTGDYFPSRLPGYPLHEFVTALLIKGGWVTTNLSTVLISVVGTYLFARLLRELDLPQRGALTLAFAFAPLLWINSVMTMDYMWALTFILGAYLALLRRAPNAAGLALGLAVGFRLTSALMLLPFWLLLWRSGRRGEVRPFTLIALGTAFVAYVPVFMDYGLNFLNFYDQSVPVEEFIKRLGKDGLGIIGALAVIVALALSLPRLRRFPGDLLRDAHVLCWSTAILVYLVSYTRLPHEIAYLIPLFPFGFFLMARYLSPGLLLGALAAIVLAGFVDITSPEDAIGITTRTFTSARVGQGMLFSDVETLRNQMDFARDLRRRSLDPTRVQRPAVVIVGFIYPEFVMLHKDELEIGILEKDEEAISQLSDKGIARDLQHAIDYVWLLEYEPFQKFLDESRSIYYTADAARSTFFVYGYRPAYFEAQRLRLTRENPSLGEGTAAIDR